MTCPIRFIGGAAALLILLAATGAGAQQTLTYDSEGQQVSLAIPKGYCEMDNNHPADARFLQVMREATRAFNIMVTAFADCTQREDWRNGKRPLLDHYGYFGVPREQARRIYRKGQEGANKELRAEFAKLDTGAFDLGMQKGKESGENAVKNVTGDDITLDKPRLLGRLNDDANGFYVGSQVHLATPHGDKDVLIIYSTMVLSERVVVLYMYDRYNGDPAEVVDLLKKTMAYSTLQHQSNR